MATRYQKLCDELRAQPKRWLVTGCAGFIGSALLEQLFALGQEVVGLDSFVTGHRSNIEAVTKGIDTDQFRFIEGDIRELSTCQNACEGVDIVLHQAALGSVPRSLDDPLASHDANVTGFLTMGLAARDAGVRRFVYASSSSVYGDHPKLPKTEDDIGKPLSPYAATKYINEVYAGILQGCYELETIGLRYFNVFGRRQDPNGPYAAVIPRWLDRLIAGEQCDIFGDGENSRDFCYVDNAVQANLLAGTCDGAATGTVYNVGVSGRTSLNQLFVIIRDYLAEHKADVASTEPHYGDPRPGDVPHSQASVDKLITALGYEPSHDIRAGLRETVAWYMAQRAG